MRKGHFCFSSEGVVWECHEHRVMEEALHRSDRFRLLWYYHGEDNGIGGWSCASTGGLAGRTTVGQVELIPDRRTASAGR